MMSCIIVEDEQLVRDLLEDNVRQVPYLKMVKACRNAMEAMDLLQQQNIDLIFLDIQMPALNGLQLLQSLVTPPLVILVTAYEEYALQGFDLQVVDYILKPFRFERFLKACNRANELFKWKQIRPGDVTAQEAFYVSVEYTHVKIVASDIEYIEGFKDYIRIFLSSTTRPVLTRMTMKAMEEKLPAGSFVRTHKSYLVSVKKITAIRRDLVCIGRKELPLSNVFRENVSRIINPHA
jgi:DNA-binding LytR/AlgR family response regulator